jgi:threonine dehydrogenase-like Zn-dependent dehydrogenase
MSHGDDSTKAIVIMGAGVMGMLIVIIWKLEQIRLLLVTP